MASTNFASNVDAWTKQTDKRMIAVFRQSALMVSQEVRKPKAQGGNMPVLTGNLRRSLVAATGSMPQARAGVKFKSDPSAQITVTIANAQPGQSIFFGFQAIYAPFAEARNGFVRLVVQRWPSIVKEAAQAIRSRVEARR